MMLAVMALGVIAIGGRLGTVPFLMCAGVRYASIKM